MPRRLHLPRRVVVAGALLGPAPGTAEAARFQAKLDAFAALDRAAPSPAGAVLFVGSSTIRLWPEMARRFAPLPVVRRGFGGATLAEVHTHRARLFRPHRPRAVVLYAGENDIVEGASPPTVVERWRRLRSALTGTEAGDAPFAFIALKPSPARFAFWPAMRRTNDAMGALDVDGPDAIVDTADFVLRPDGTPDPRLFADGVHFNLRGYDRLTQAMHATLQSLQLWR